MAEEIKVKTVLLPDQHLSAKTPTSLPVESPSLIVVLLLHMARAAAVLAELD